MEVQADPEEQQDHPDLRQLPGDPLVGRESRRVRADGHARQEVAHDRREPQAVGDEAEHEGGGEPAGERQDEVNVVHGGRSRGGGPAVSSSACRRRRPAP